LAETKTTITGASTSSSAEAIPAASRLNLETKNSLNLDPRTEAGDRRDAPPRSKNPSDDWRRLVEPPIRPPNSKKLFIDLKIDTALEDTPSEPAVETVNDDMEGMDVDPDVEEVDDVEKNVDLEVEDDEADEESSQQDEDAQPIDDAGEGDDEPADPEREGDGDDEQEQEQELETNEVEKTTTKRRTKKNLYLTAIWKTRKLNFSTHIEQRHWMYWHPSSLNSPCYENECTLRKWRSWVGKSEWSKLVSFIHSSSGSCVVTLLSSSCPSIPAKGNDEMEGQTLELASRKRSYEVSNATKRRKADEDGVWSWWKVKILIYLSSRYTNIIYSLRSMNCKRK